MTDINQKIEIVRTNLIDGWSIQYAFSKARIKPHTDEYHFVYDKLKYIIEVYKINKINDRRHPLYR